MSPGPVAFLPFGPASIPAFKQQASPHMLSKALWPRGSAQQQAKLPPGLRESSGRSVFLELSDVRMAATMALQSQKVQVFDASIPILVAIGIVGLSTLSVAFFGVFGKK
jgi:hypothetical protein